MQVPWRLGYGRARSGWSRLEPTQLLVGFRGQSFYLLVATLKYVLYPLRYVKEDYDPRATEENTCKKMYLVATCDKEKQVSSKSLPGFLVKSQQCVGKTPPFSTDKFSKEN